MRNIQKTPDPIAGNIFCKPVWPAQYANESCVARSWIVKDTTRYNRRMAYRKLGENPKTERVEGLFAQIPDMYVHELHDVVLYKSVVCTPDGGYFYESCPRPLENAPQTLLNGRNSGPYPSLGAGRFVLEDVARHKTVIEEPCVMFHIREPSYGHALLEVAPMLWPLIDDRVDLKAAKWLVNPRYHKIPQFLLDFARPFGLQHALEIAPDLALCRKLFVISRPLHPSGRYISTEAAKVFKAISRYYTADMPETYAKKIYVSRRFVNERKLINEEECESLFKDEGFTSIYPESMSIPEQIQAYAKAEYVAGPIGTGLHNILYSLHPDKVRLLALSPEVFSPVINFIQIESLYQRMFHVVYGKHIDTKASYLVAPWTIDVDNVRAAIRQWI